MKRIIVIAGGCILLIGIVIFVIWLQRPFREIEQLNERFCQIKAGMSVAEVKDLMGGEGIWREADFQAWWDDERLGATEDARIEKAVKYSVATFFSPVTFEITFDKDNNVVGRHRYD